MHVMSEPCFSVLLLFAGNESIFHLFHHHDLLFVLGQQHEHACCEITAAEGVLSIERQWAQVGHITIEHHKWNAGGMQLVSKLSCHVKFGWNNNHTIRI